MAVTDVEVGNAFASLGSSKQSVLINFCFVHGSEWQHESKVVGWNAEGCEYDLFGAGKAAPICIVHVALKDYCPATSGGNGQSIG